VSVRAFLLIRIFCVGAAKIPAFIPCCLVSAALYASLLAGFAPCAVALSLALVATTISLSSHSESSMFALYVV
jgi:hypothetical protein